MNNVKEFKIRVLDSKSPTFCGAKWYHASMWLNAGITTSCHHNPPHAIDINALDTNPSALHNTPIKKHERRMLQKGERPKNCQFCWVMEDLDTENISDRVYQSTVSSEESLEYAFRSSPDIDVDPHYLEVSFDPTCQLACSYCCPAISTSWARDIKQNGPYTMLPTDHRNHYTDDGRSSRKYGHDEKNPYVEAWFRWWNQSLHRNLKQLRITGGEPMMSQHTWRLLDWLANNSNQSDTRIEITTNLTYDGDLVARMLDYVSRIKQPVWIYTSGESIGEKAQYVRDGHNWEQWLRNVEQIRKSGIVENLSVTGTMSAISNDGFVDWLGFLLDQKRMHGRDWMLMSVNLVRFPTFQNIVVLPSDLRKQYAAEIESILNRPDINQLLLPYEQDHISRYMRYLKGVIEPHGDTDIDHDALRKDFKSFFTQYDNRRGKNFQATFPRLADWYDQIPLT
jgi:organic radical activating enzyme